MARAQKLPADMTPEEHLLLEKNWATPADAKAPLLDNAMRIPFDAPGLQMSVGAMFKSLACGFKS